MIYDDYHVYMDWMSTLEMLFDEQFHRTSAVND